jgi:AraC family transcriptional regulator
MRVMVIVKASKRSEAGEMPSQQLLTEMGKFNEELVKAGIMLAGEGLHPSSKGVRVNFEGKTRTVIDGPFAETKELLAGYWIWQVKSMQEAIEWIKRCPNPHEDGGIVEIRPIFSPEDFGENLTPELRNQEERLGAEMAKYQLEPPRIEKGREMLIVGINATYTFETRVNIPKQWERFALQIGKVPGQIGKVSYGVCWNFKPGIGFDYLTGVEVSDGAKLPADYAQIRITSQRYAVFTHRKHYSFIPQMIEAIWNKWLPNSGYTPAESPSFERYTEEFDPKTGTGGTEIWIPIKG